MARAHNPTPSACNSRPRYLMTAEKFEPRFPNMRYGWKMPVRRLSWSFAWWVLKRVALHGYTTHQQAATIYEALGPYKRPREEQLREQREAA